MKKSIKLARVAQLFGAVLLVLGIVSCSQKGGDAGMMASYFLSGFLLIVGARVYEWLAKE